MNEKFTKDDLQVGYVVELRNGDLQMISLAGKNTKIVVGVKGDWKYLSNAWDSRLNAVNRSIYVKGSLMDVSDQDVVKVYGLINDSKHYGKCLHMSTENRPLLWSRKQPKKMTMKDIEDELGYDIELVCENNDEDEIDYADVYNDFVVHYPGTAKTPNVWSPAYEFFPHKAIRIYTNGGEFYYSYGAKVLQPIK